MRNPDERPASYAYQYKFHEISTEPKIMAKVWAAPEEDNRDLQLQILERLSEILQTYMHSLSQLTEFSAQIEPEVKRLLKDGYNHVQVAYRLNLDSFSVRHYQQRTRDLQTLTMIVNGKSQTQIAGVIGVTQETVSKYCHHRNGLFSRLRAVADVDPEIVRLRAEIQEAHN